MLGQKLSMFAQAIAGALDLHHDGVMQQAVQEGCGDHRITEDVAPLGEAAIRSQDHGGTLVAGVDQLEEQIAAVGADWQITNFVDLC